MKKINFRLPRKTIVFNIGFTTIPNQKAFEGEIRSYFNSHYPRMNFDDKNDFAFLYDQDPGCPKLFVDRLQNRIQNSTTFSQTLIQDLKKIAKKYGYKGIQFPLHYK